MLGSYLKTSLMLCFKKKKIHCTIQSLSCLETCKQPHHKLKTYLHFLFKLFSPLKCFYLKQIGRSEKSIKTWFANRRTADARQGKKRVFVPLVRSNARKHLTVRQRRVLEEFYMEKSKFPRLEDFMKLSLLVCFC